MKLRNGESVNSQGSEETYQALSKFANNLNDEELGRLGRESAIFQINKIIKDPTKQNDTFKDMAKAFKIKDEPDGHPAHSPAGLPQQLCTNSILSFASFAI